MEGFHCNRIVMMFVTSLTLISHLKKSPLSPCGALSLSSQVAPRLRKKVAPSLTSGRQRRPKPQNSDRDKLDPEQDRGTHTDTAPCASADSTNLTLTGSDVATEQCSSQRDGGREPSQSSHPHDFPQGNDVRTVCQSCLLKVVLPCYSVFFSYSTLYRELQPISEVFLGKI